MNFFEQLSSTGNVDVTLRIMQKNDKLTINVMPGSGQSQTQPIIITGSPKELDGEFFSTLYPQVDELAGIIHNIEEVKKQATQKQESIKKPATASKVEKKEAVKKADKKPAASEKVDLFAAAEQASPLDVVDEVEKPESDNDQTSNDDDEQTEEDPGDHA